MTQDQQHQTKDFFGTLSLDLDGTTVQSGFPIQTELVETLKRLQSRGATILFNTGRNFSFAKLALPNLDFPHFIAGQNGAVLVNGLTNKVLIQRNLPLNFLNSFDEWEQKFGVSFIVETGAQNNDECCYKPISLTEALQKYFEYRQKIQKIEWTSVSNWNELREPYSMVKVFAKTEALDELMTEIDASWDLAKVRIKDPFREDGGILLINAKGVDKGSMLDEFIQQGLGKRPCIAAGDDTSDLPMLQKSEFALVSEDASLQLRKHANYEFNLGNIAQLLNQIAKGEKEV